jgi:REP element-mobilizing transposase RayT
MSRINRVLDDLAQAFNCSLLRAAGRGIELHLIHDAPLDEKVYGHVLAIERKHLLRCVIDFQDAAREFSNRLDQREFPMETRLVLSSPNLTKAQLDCEFALVNRKRRQAYYDEDESNPHQDSESCVVH